LISTARWTPLPDGAGQRQIISLHLAIIIDEARRKNCGKLQLLALSNRTICFEMRFPAEITRPLNARLRSPLLILIFFHVVTCCVSVAYAAQLYPTFHIFYDPKGLFDTILIVAAFALVSLLFVLADFSFGYFVGFYFYTMVVGYLWLTFFSDFTYNRELAGLSAAVSAVVFLLPVLFISTPVRQFPGISPRTFDRLLTFLFLLSLATVAIGASYNFRLVSPRAASSLRSDVIPTIPRYIIGITSSVLLPFLFACFVARKSSWRAGAVLCLLLLYYPITISKTALFAPAWLIFLALLSRIFKANVAVILSLLGPILAGVILLTASEHVAILYNRVAIPYFEIVNFRMVAVPSTAMDFYNDFFSKHDLTYFCQIQALKSMINCPYHDQLGVVMRDTYASVGNFNASLFATEGIASVGLLFAPVSVFVCGLVIALGNRLSAGLPPSFILVSGSILPQILLNVAFSTALLTHGAAFLFLLWYITPRSMFEQHDGININRGSAVAPTPEQLDGTGEIALCRRKQIPAQIQ
jgi:hypothetical protein